MAVVKPFKALRPAKDLVDKVASLPYDVMNREEAAKMAEGNPYSFLHIVRSEMDVASDVSQYDKSVYEKARENLIKFEEEKTLIQDDKAMYYIYRQTMDGRSQTGLVATCSVDDYMNDVIKKHEFTRPAKEEDRVNNFDHCDANTAPIFLTYKSNDRVNEIVKQFSSKTPEYDFTSEDGVGHTVWLIDDVSVNSEIESLFDKIGNLYIADGHHRSASAARVGKKRREEFPNYDGTEEFNFFMAVIFPDEELYVMDYNRVVKDLNGNTPEEFLSKVSEKFDVKEYGGSDEYRPKKKNEFGLYLEKKWYILEAKAGTFDSKHPVNSLDAAILQDNLLNPILGIEDPRTDERIDFVGGIRGLGELVRRCETDMKLAISMYSVTIDDLIDVADAGMVMPPKSTWFEPKLRSGLFVHKLQD